MSGTSSQEKKRNVFPSLESSARTHVGRVRKHNEDAILAEPLRGLFAVIDGMGGEKAGEVAAHVARESFLQVPDLVLAVQIANERMIQRGWENAEEQGMGCVLTAVSIGSESLQLVHVGDTRAYLASAVGCEQLTRDHTTVAEAQERLGLTDAQARALPGQHSVTRDVGREIHSDSRWIDRSNTDFLPGDLLLICSDGLHDVVPDARLRLLLSEARRVVEPVDQLAERLEVMALEGGGHDNISIVVVRQGGLPGAAEAVSGWRALLRRKVTSRVFAVAVLIALLAALTAVAGSLGLFSLLAGP